MSDQRLFCPVCFCEDLEKLEPLDRLAPSVGAYYQCHGCARLWRVWFDEPDNVFAEAFAI